MFEKVGPFNEKLVKSHDMDFNIRLKKAGRILLDPDIVSCYYPDSTLSWFLRHNFLDGTWSLRPLKFGSPLAKLRHLVMFVMALVGSGALAPFAKHFLSLFLAIFGLYLCVNVYFSARIALRQKDIGYLFIMPIVFAARHISYGLGSLWGIVKKAE